MSAGAGTELKILIGQIEIARLVVSMTSSLAGILVGAFFIVFGLKESWAGASKKLKDHYVRSLRLLSIVLGVNIATLLLAVLDLTTQYPVSAWLLPLFCLVLAGMLSSVLYLFWAKP